MKIEIINSDFIKDMQEFAYNTQDKKTNGKMSVQVFEKYIISEHSPIRELKIKVTIQNIDTYSSVHFTRHFLGLNHSVKSNRPDIAKKERSVNDTVTHIISGNAQSFINIAKVRLCSCSSISTQKIMQEIKKGFETHENEYLRAYSKYLVPSCVYRLGCPEFKKCSVLPKFIKSKGILTDIKQRCSEFAKHTKK